MFILSFTSVEWLILDECDKLFEDGVTGFKDQVHTYNFYYTLNVLCVRLMRYLLPVLIRILSEAYSVLH